MSIYSDKLAHVQVVINCRYSVAPMFNCEDTVAHNLGAPYIDDIMSYNSLTKSAIWMIPLFKCQLFRNPLYKDVRKQKKKYFK